MEKWTFPKDVSTSQSISLSANHGYLALPTELVTFSFDLSEKDHHRGRYFSSVAIGADGRVYAVDDGWLVAYAGPED